MNLTLTKYKIANKLFNKPMPMAVLNWNNPKRVQARKAMMLEAFYVTTFIMAMLVACTIDSLVELIL